MRGNKPVYRIEADGVDITAAIRDRLISGKTTDRAGIKSDRLTLTLDDRDGIIDLPQMGVGLAVWLGWGDAALTLIGRYTMDKLGLRQSPNGAGQMVIEGKAADLRGSLKSQRVRAWRDTSLGAVIDAIAAANKLIPVVGASVRDRPVDSDQDGESDLHFLTRLARQHDCTAKVAEGRLIVVQAGTGTAADGSPLPMTIIRPSDVIGDVAVDWSLRDDHGKVKAGYHDLDTGEMVYEEAGVDPATTADERPDITLRRTYASAAEAKAAAEADHAARTRARASMSCKIWGRADVQAEAPALLTGGFRTGIGGQWLLSDVDQDWSAEGWTTSIKSQPPGEKKRKGDDDWDPVADSKR